MKNLAETNSELRAYIAGLKEEENRSKLVCIIVVGAVLLTILTIGVVCFIKKKYDEECLDDWDEDWDDEDECDGECCCTDSDVDDSVKVKPYEK